ncbi:MAG: hypothetical protein QXN55_01660 [Candidatus Nitrosotenuis sp.]
MKFNYVELKAELIPGIGRIYETPERKHYASITTILGATMEAKKRETLKNWSQSIGVEKAEKITQEAADKGTNVHLMIEHKLLGRSLDYADFPAVDVSAFKTLLPKLKNIDEVWGLEVPLYSDLLEVAGRTDCVGIYKCKPCIIDFKTSRRLKNDDDISDYKLQLAFYSVAHNERFGTDIEDGVILMTAAEGFPMEFRVDLIPEIERLVARIDEYYNKLAQSA